MPPQGEQNNQPISPEVTSPEAPASVEATVNVETPPAPAPVQQPPVVQESTVANAPANPVAPAPVEPVQESDSVPVPDEAWVGAVDQVIEKTKGKPYEEEEEAEGLQIKYLLKRFGKILKRDK